MRIVLVCLLSGLAVASTAIGQEKQIVLPADHDYATLKPGLHSELAQTQCQFCHSTDYIVMQPGGDAKQWDAVVAKMVKVFGLPSARPTRRPSPNTWRRPTAPANSWAGPGPVPATSSPRRFRGPRDIQSSSPSEGPRDI